MSRLKDAVASDRRALVAVGLAEISLLEDPVTTVNMLEAKSSLSRLVKAVESGEESEIIIARNGKPVARLVAIGTGSGGMRLGVARGKFKVPKTIDAQDNEVAKLFDDPDILEI